MNIAIGFPCPECGHQEANLLEIERDHRAQPVAFRLHCTRCEAVFRARHEPVREEVPSGLFRAW